MSELRLGLVGCGRLAERGYLEAIRRARGAKLVGLADLEQARCSSIAPPLPGYSEPAELLSRDDLDAVVFATPAGAHLEGARLASQEDLPALIEKPPAESAAKVTAMAALDRQPWFGFNRRFEHGISRLRDRVPADGVLELTMDLSRPRRSWRSHEASDDALLGLGPHLIDLAAWLTASRVEHVRALELSPETARLELSLARGLARIDCASGSTPLDRIQVRREGRLCARYSGGGLLHRGARRLCRPLGAGALVRSLALQLEAFVSAVRGGGRGPLADCRDALAVMEAIDAARRSSAGGGGWIALPPAG